LHFNTITGESGSNFWGSESGGEGGVTNTGEGVVMAITLKGQHKNPGPPHAAMRSISFNSPVTPGPREPAV